MHLTRLLVVDAPHFYAASVWNGKVCVGAAPILKWMIGKAPLEVRNYLVRKKWSYQWVESNVGPAKPTTPTCANT